MAELRVRVSCLMAALAIVFMFAGIASAQESDLARAQQLLRQGQAAQAYAILEPLESANAGDLNFDYAMGVAALDSGHADRAVIALERVLADVRAAVADWQPMLGRLKAVRESVLQTPRAALMTVCSAWVSPPAPTARPWSISSWGTGGWPAPRADCATNDRAMTDARARLSRASSSLMSIS